MTLETTLFILAVTAFAYWKKDAIMYLIAGIGLIVFAYIWVDFDTIDTVAPSAIALILGLYTVAKAAMNQLRS